jgi:hypothetical protein
MSGARTWPTTTYWQRLLDGWPDGVEPRPPYRFDYPVRLPDGRVLLLPLRELPEGGRAVASLIANQASFGVVSALADHMADLARTAGIDIVVGVPTLGLAFAPLVAERLGHERFAPLGYSRKFWYEDALSEPVFSTPARAVRRSSISIPTSCRFCRASAFASSTMRSRRGPRCWRRTGFWRGSVWSWRLWWSP